MDLVVDVRRTEEQCHFPCRRELRNHLRSGMDEGVKVLGVRNPMEEKRRSSQRVTEDLVGVGNEDVRGISGEEER